MELAKKRRENPIKLKHKAAFIWVYELRQTIDKHIPEWIEFKQFTIYPFPFSLPLYLYILF